MPCTAQVPIQATLIGLPTDVGASRLGAAMGPDALRVAQLAPALEKLGVQVSDLGNLSGPANPRGARDEQGLRNLAECLNWNQIAHDAVLQEQRMRVLVDPRLDLAVELAQRAGDATGEQGAHIVLLVQLRLHMGQHALGLLGGQGAQGLQHLGGGLRLGGGQGWGLARHG